LKRAAVLYEPLFDMEMDLEAIGANHVPLLDLGQAPTQGDVEKSILEGFHLLRRTWSLAANIMLRIRAYARIKTRGSANGQLLREAELMGIADLYLDFAAALDNLPPTLQNPNSSTCTDEESVAQYHRVCFTSQRFRLLSMYYATKLMIIHECSKYELTAAVGLRSEESTLATEKINVARDFIHNLQCVPFEYIQGNGESD
jgi:hypothetical protein